MTQSGRVAMLGTSDSGIPIEALRRAAVRATLAPSVHNTQPWQFLIGSGTLEILADYRRQLQVLDPARRQLIISCGCALFNARVSLAAAGYPAAVQRFRADDGSPESPVEAGGSAVPSQLGLAPLDPVLGLRRTNRREFASDPVPCGLVEELIAAASRESARLCSIRTPAHRRATAALSQRADAIENADPGYRAELRAWVSDDPYRPDGVTAATFPPTAPPAGQLALRDYGEHVNGALPAHSRASTPSCLLLLGTDEDDPVSWLRAGEALERVWLEVTRAGFAMSLFTQVIEVPSTRERLRSELGLSLYPHVLLRVGRAPATPASRRRKLVDVLRQSVQARD